MIVAHKTKIAVKEHAGFHFAGGGVYMVFSIEVSFSSVKGRKSPVCCLSPERKEFIGIRVTEIPICSREYCPGASVRQQEVLQTCKDCFLAGRCSGTGEGGL